MPKSRNKRKNRKRNMAIKEQKRNIRKKEIRQHIEMGVPMMLMYDKFLNEDKKRPTKEGE